MKFYCYVYRDPSRNNEPIYVGKGHGRRAQYHLSRKDHHPLTHRIKKMLELGVEPDIEIIEALDEDHAFFLEVVLIDMFGRRDIGKGSLLNLTDGGEGPSGVVHKPETIKKIADKNRGRPRSEETKRRISSALTNHTHSDATRRKMSQTRQGKSTKSPSAELRAHLSAKMTGRVRTQVCCPYCQKSGGEGIMRRWHFINCKMAPLPV